VGEKKMEGGIYLTPVDTTGCIWGNGRLPTDIDGVRTAIFIGRSVSGIFGGSSMAGVCMWSSCAYQCSQYAYAYYGAVNNWGQAVYESAQVKACVCCNCN
jgi:hypothetical protein